MIAGLIWFFENATDLELSAVLLILGTAGLVKALVEGNLDMFWSSAGVVVSFGWRVISDVTHHPAGGLAGFLVGAVTLVCFGVGFVLLIKDGSLGQVWKALRARLASGSRRRRADWPRASRGTSPLPRALLSSERAWFCAYEEAGGGVALAAVGGYWCVAVRLRWCAGGWCLRVW